LTTSSSSTVTVEAPPPVSELEVRLALHSIYFPTALPTAQEPNGGLLVSQQQTLTALASDFLKYLQTKPDAHLILEGHADVRGSVPYNQALSERRVERTKSFLMEEGVPAANIDTKALGDQHNLTPDEVKSQVETNPELTPEEQQRILRKMKTIIWASNRRVDIALSTTGQESVRHFPFNAADSLSLIGGREAAKKKTAPPANKEMKKK
jgi:outer membrane protein OmpA-like peptidoglycan-associated protein